MDTAMDVARHLARLSAELAKVVKALGEEETVATALHKVFRDAYATAWLKTSGIAESRKQETYLATSEEWYAYETALTEIRKYKQRIDEIEKRISVGQSYGKALQSEIAISGSRFHVDA